MTETSYQYLCSVFMMLIFVYTLLQGWDKLSSRQKRKLSKIPFDYLDSMGGWFQNRCRDYLPTPITRKLNKKVITYTGSCPAYVVKGRKRMKRIRGAKLLLVAVSSILSAAHGSQTSATPQVTTPAEDAIYDGALKKENITPEMLNIAQAKVNALNPDLKTEDDGTDNLPSNDNCACCTHETKCTPSYKLKTCHFDIDFAEMNECMVYSDTDECNSNNEHSSYSSFEQPKPISQQTNIIENVKILIEEYENSGTSIECVPFHNNGDVDTLECSPAIEEDSDDDSDDDEDDEYFACQANPHRRNVNTINFDSDSYPLGIDTFASCCMTPFKEDFIPGTLQDLRRKKKVRPFKKGAKLEVCQSGTVSWSFQDGNGVIHDFKIKNVLYVPDGSHRLLSPQHMAVNGISKLYPMIHFKSLQLHNRNILIWGPKNEFIRVVRNSRMSNVPILYSAPSTTSYREFNTEFLKNSKKQLSETVAFVSEVNDNDDDKSRSSKDNNNTSERNSSSQSEGESDNPLDQSNDENIQEFFHDNDSPSEIQVIDEQNNQQTIAATTDRAELLRWHYRLGHMSFAVLQKMAEQGILPRRLAQVKTPKCACCWYGKQTRKPWRIKGHRGHIKLATKPGQCVSVDQMESSSLGFFGQLKGRLTNRKYKYATVFVDHYSRYSYVHLQTDLTSEQTVEAKVAFELHMKDLGVTVSHYHADNGRFADNLFVKHVNQCGQSITYCGVNAHWQNGVAEKMIRDLRDSARTQLLHAIGKWPQAIDVSLWPYALRHACNIRNVTPNTKKGVLSPIEKLTGADVSPNLRHMHTFGCPVYALHNRIQAGQPINQWNPRSRLGIYLGNSPKHARSVSLVLSAETGLVSPQFHVQHDEFFETVTAAPKGKHLTWKGLANILKFRNNSASNNSSTTMPPSLERSLAADTSSSEEIPIDILNELNWHDDTDLEPDEARENTTTEEGVTDQPPEAPNIQNSEVLHTSESQAPSEQMPSQEPESLGRGHRRIKITEAGKQLPPGRLQDRLNDFIALSSIVSPVLTEEEYYEKLHDMDYEIQDQMQDPIAFKATSDPDTLYYHQAMAADDKDQFLAAIVKEVNDHILNGHWELVPASKVPKGTKVLDSVWSMKRKRDIKTRKVYKYKARLNLHGGQQEKGVHYNETYSPVISWPPLRLITTWALIKGWHTKQIDFVLAFPQADIPFENYMKLPHGIKTIHGNGDTHVLRLKKNLYGGRNAGKVWYDHLRDGLENIGFEKSRMDDCVFFRKDVIFVFYVDDGILYSPSMKSINKALKDLGNVKKTKRNLVFEDQGDVTDYLGINFERLPGNRISMTQPHIIQQILDEVGITDDMYGKQTPAAPDKVLRRDADEPSITPPFDYRKVVGKLNFLEKSTRPDISYAVHQCARFCSDPKQSHVDAIIYLARYLKATKNEGIIFAPDPKESFDVWADADFSGNWNKRTAEYDESTSKSRSGYVITLAGCPIFWSSKLQTQVALSSCESEYICLSQALREALPLMDLVREMKERDFLTENCTPRVHCKAFEDNSGALEMAKVHKMRPRTKHINIVYHHFRKAVKSGLVSIHKVDTGDQLADIFTKPLSRNLLHKFRRRLQKWGEPLSNKTTSTK